jgi:hypothetical protein
VQARLRTRRLIVGLLTLLLVLVLSLVIGRQSSTSFSFVLKDRLNGVTISNASVRFSVVRDFPLVGRLTFLPSDFRQRLRSYSVTTVNGIIRLPSGYPDPEKWFVIEAAGYDGGPFNMQTILEMDRHAAVPKSPSSRPIVWLERVPTNSSLIRPAR